MDPPVRDYEENSIASRSTRWNKKTILLYAPCSSHFAHTEIRAGRDADVDERVEEEIRLKMKTVPRTY